jgi:glycosyltransferase involved in cell wall biosynthesis
VTDPLISCIVPVYNGAHFLGEALDSILAQTYRRLEVIVVDDGSTDATPAVASEYGPLVSYVRQTHAGVASARNRGLAEASGDFVAFLDADDRWHSEKLARQMARFAARPELDLSVTGGQNFWMPGLAEMDERSRDPRYTEPWPGYGSPVTLLARRVAFDTVGPFDPRFTVSEDRDWFIRAAELGLISELLEEVLVYRRLHGANLSDPITPAVAAQVHLQLAKASLDRRRRRAP